MKKSRSILLVSLVLTLSFAAAFVGGAEAGQLCISLKLPGVQGDIPMPGAPSISVNLSIASYGDYYHLVGQGTFSQAITPPAGYVKYNISGVASPSQSGVNVGWWLPLEGTGYDLAGNLYRGLFVILLNNDTTKSTFTYTQQRLDGTTLSTMTGTAQIEASCPSP